MTKFKTRPGKRRALPEDEALENVDMDEDVQEGEDAAPREKYVEMLVRRPRCHSLSSRERVLTELYALSNG